MKRVLLFSILAAGIAAFVTGCADTTTTTTTTHHTSEVSASY